MKAVTSGPTPTPAAATVAAYSTSRLPPSTRVSLTYRRGTPPPVRARGRDEEVAVRDPAAERLQGQVEAGELRHALQRRDERVAELAVDDLTVVGVHRSRTRRGGTPG